MKNILIGKSELKVILNRKLKKNLKKNFQSFQSYVKFKLFSFTSKSGTSRPQFDAAILFCFFAPFLISSTDV